MKKTKQIKIRDVLVGGGAPIAVQSMTNTDTRDAMATLAQIEKLHKAGADLVRISVYDEACVRSVRKLVDYSPVPLIADIHFDHRLAIGAMENGIHKLRINPGNIERQEDVRRVVDCAKAHKVPIRIGVNTGSLPKDLVASMGVTPDSMVEAALRHVRILEACGFFDIALSLKASDVRTNVLAYRKMAGMCDYPLHLGVTEAGRRGMGNVKSDIGIGALLLDGIGDTIRVSLSGDPVPEVEAGLNILRALNLRRDAVNIVSCPTCGRTQYPCTEIANEVEVEMEGLDVSAERKREIVERRLRSEINRGVQTIQYQVVTLMTTNGQAPFITVFMYLGEARNPQEKADLAIIIEETIRQRYQGVKNEAGVWITPAFPKLIYVLEEDNIRPGTPYYYLTELAAKCTAKRMVPDYISEKKMLELKVDKNGEGHCYTCMGCRSFLTPYVDPETGKPKYYGRFNQGVVTINLVDVALSSGGNFDKFWKIFDERLDLCHRALQARHKRLLGTPSDAAPILWQYGALARLKKGEKIDKLLFGGYSTISLGYAGLYECVKYMTGRSHTDAGAKPFALSVMQHMNDKCNEWKNAENIDYSLYGTPLESTTYKFAKCLQKRFGIVPGITDRNYITNSYHVHVTEQIDAFTKLKFESEFQRLSPGGAISYVEVPNMQDNLEAVIKVMQFIYDNIMYAELNTKSDYCQVCGYDGEIKIVEDDGKLVWECPHCHNRDQSKLNVARRTCGYIGTQFWNQGRTAEIKDRVLHL